MARDYGFDHIYVDIDSKVAIALINNWFVAIRACFCLVQDILRYIGNGVIVLFSSRILLEKGTRLQPLWLNLNWSGGGFMFEFPLDFLSFNLLADSTNVIFLRVHLDEEF